MSVLGIIILVGVVVAVLLTIWSFKLFTVIYVLTAGGPAGAALPAPGGARRDAGQEGPGDAGRAEGRGAGAGVPA